MLRDPPVRAKPTAVLILPALGTATLTALRSLPDTRLWDIMPP
jgi:hypothetical protein